MPGFFSPVFRRDADMCHTRKHGTVYHAGAL